MYVPSGVLSSPTVLVQIAQRLDRWMAAQNRLRIKEGLPQLKPCVIRVIGQMALFEAKVALTLVATRDVDVRADYEHVVERKFAELLAQRGWVIDPVAHEAWMPRETRYTGAFGGALVHLLVAEPEAVLVSKALKAPSKNRALIAEYLALGASQRFQELASKYDVNLEQFV